MWAEILVLTLTTTCVMVTMARYAKTRRDDALKHPIRKRIREFLLGKPGPRLTDLLKGLGTPRATTSYHLMMLERFGFILSTSVDGVKRYFPSDSDKRDLDGFCVLLRGRVLELAIRLITDPGANQKQLTRMLAMRGKVFREYARILDEHDLVDVVPDHPYKRYFPTNRLQRLVPLVQPRAGADAGSLAIDPQGARPS